METIVERAEAADQGIQKIDGATGDQAASAGESGAVTGGDRA